MNGTCESPVERPGSACPADPTPGRQRVAWRTWFVPPIVLLLLAGVALAIDMPVARWAQGRNYPRAVRELMSLAEAFGHGVGVSLVVVTVYTLDPARRRRLPRSIIAVVAAGCGANLIKLLISRSRPGATDLLHLDAWHTFAGWLPLGHNGSPWQSFPSAHTATAVGLALVLSSLYPQGRRLFALFAVAVGLQRILGGAHFPSDVLAGAAIGWWCAVGVLQLRRRCRTCTRAFTHGPPRSP
ncbi:MAG: phosphatase PAP2 family protein [Pirellulales bacterium]